MVILPIAYRNLNLEQARSGRISLGQAGSSVVGPHSAAVLPRKVSKYFLKVFTFILQKKKLQIYCTSKRNLNVGQIRPFIENWESFRKFGHGGPTQNSILRRTTVTDF